MDNALSHMSFWIVQHIQQVKLQAEALEKDESLTAEQKQERSGVLYRTLLSLIVILQPAIDFAKMEYPQCAPLIDWAENIFKDAMAKGQITGSCGCNNCNIGHEDAAVDHK